VLNNQDNIRALAPVTTVMLHALGTQFTRFTGTKVQTLDVEGAAKKNHFQEKKSMKEFYFYFFYRAEPSTLRILHPAGSAAAGVPARVPAAYNCARSCLRAVADVHVARGTCRHSLYASGVCVYVRVCYRDAALLR
jgi:hypothetical protein